MSESIYSEATTIKFNTFYYCIYILRLCFHYTIKYATTKVTEKAILMRKIQIKR